MKTAQRTLIDLSTAALKCAEKLEFWQDMTRQAMVGCVISSSEPSAFDIHVDGFVQNDLSIVDVRCTSFEVERKPELFEAPDDVVLLFFIRSGKLFVEQDNRSALIEPDNGVMVACDRPYKLHVLGPHEAYSVRVPRLLFIPKNNIDAFTVRPIPISGIVGNILWSYVYQLYKNGKTADDDLVIRIMHSFANILAVTFDQNYRQIHLTSRERTLQRVKAFIDMNCHRADLTPAAVSARTRLTPRYLNKLFEAEKTSLGRYLLAQRLDKAAADIVSSVDARKSITQIALDAGFKDLSHFSSAFRARFDLAPSAYRDRLVAGKRTGNLSETDEQ
ncbi:helix-turn-helix domain-containing protein [Phreatobacter sp. AB_2022a]|uniref:helix-turn-helix domain-containing protein n=1 Tax=Phreatobacter sp. AB_2022a TaxID=3003134 RepID=UPI002286ED18|nr:helix-turn-helix domain-containing protein [Phreatobacter sp. AB_2022a]MCZ0738325.1 helix-turn-helix domain-containing protein [Phreatobacter sp. AB_2022a]